MKALITSVIIPALQTRFERPFLLQKTIMTYGLGESVIAERIADWESQLPPPMKLAYLPSLGRSDFVFQAKDKMKTRSVQPLTIKFRTWALGEDIWQKMKTSLSN